MAETASIAMTAPPLMVHLIFHPASEAARRHARQLHHALNEDPASPGLRVPTALMPEDGTFLPPKSLDLDEAEHSVVVVLADDTMVIEQGLPAGRQSWAAFVADIAARCRDGRHRFLPVQLSEAAWPLHDDLSTTNFIRGYDQEEAERASGIERKIVIEICRFLLGKARGEKVPVTVFLSHAKRDIDTEPKLFHALVEHLNATQPVEAWVDSAGIESGGNFEEAIEKGIRTAAVLVLATTNYSSRPWCRREVLLAKQHARPVVVIDGLHALDTRSFPYIGNVPVIAWGHGGARRAVDLLLKEYLKQLHVMKLLERQRLGEECVLPVPPELATIVRLPKDKPILYPDPPLGDEELEILAPLGHRLTTPLQRAAAGRELAKKAVALSISESDKPEQVGMMREHLDAALLEISRHLLVRGASLAYGGHLGSAGYTIALFDLVRAHREMSGIAAPERIINYVGWPLPFATLPQAQRAKFQGQAKFIRTERPDGVEALEPQTFVAEPALFEPSTPERRYAWARGMTLMREGQTQETDARVVLGGKVGPTVPRSGSTMPTWYSGRIPGVIEETLLSLESRKPVYICGAFGGAAALVAELLQGRTPKEFTWEFQRQAPHSEGMRNLYRQHNIPWRDYDEMAAMCKTTGVAGLSDFNHLSEDENRELFRTRDLPRLVELLLLGLTRALA